MTAWSDWLDLGLDELERARLARRRAPLPLQGGPRIFSSNDYLGLSAHPRVRDAAAAAAQAHGMGPRGSALVCGHTTEHAALEVDLAALTGMEAALLTPTGFAANLSVLGALADRDTHIFSDALNHASIIDGCRLAPQAARTVFPHGDVAALARALESSERPRKLIVTDTVFSMDGDRASLRELAALRDLHAALLVVDEAHATLVFGERGGGLCQEVGVRADVHVGTLSKAIGAMGGFIAASARTVRWLVSMGRAQVFSTALPVPVVSAARAALAVAREEPHLRARLWRHAGRVGEALGLPVHSPIFPLVLGDEGRAIEAGGALERAGFRVTPIRPPTVPPGTSRLRITVSAAHSDPDIDALLGALARLGLSPG